MPLEIPSLVDLGTLNISLDVEYHNFSGITGDSLNVPIKTYAFNESSIAGVNTYLGPTLVWRQGRHQTVNITNNLPGSDTSTIHWHGAHIPAWTDGGPHQKINPQGGTFNPDFDILDSTCTLWYHPHGLDRTYVQVQMGLAGMIEVIDNVDPLNDQLPHTYGVDDFPIIIQDIFFKRIGATDTFNIDTGKVGTGRRIVVNGGVRPYLTVPPQQVRLRLLNGSTRQPYTVAVGTTRFDHIPFLLTASDGGHIPDSARTIDSILTAPGTRSEIVVDFTGREGQTLYMTCFAGESKSDSLFLQFRVSTADTLPHFSVPSTFPADPPYPFDGNTPTRTKRLLGAAIPPGQGGFSINNNQFIPEQINDTINLGATEVWIIENRSNRSHPFHIHDIQFYVIDVKDTLGNAKPIPPDYLGRKDDIWVTPGTVVRFVTQFDDFGTPQPFDVDTDTYMYHCHILTHEDGMYVNGPHVNVGMMQQFVVWDGTTTPTDPKYLAENMNLFPNPAHDILHLKGESNKASTFRIYDVQGRLLEEQSLTAFNGTTSIAVDHLAKGLVMVEWESANGLFRKKIVLR
jgi:FtsP/CotA-like multicopper oxidase with cupredoxin domain